MRTVLNRMECPGQANKKEVKMQKEKLEQLRKVFFKMLNETIEIDGFELAEIVDKLVYEVKIRINNK